MFTPCCCLGWFLPKEDIYGSLWPHVGGLQSAIVLAIYAYRHIFPVSPEFLDLLKLMLFDDVFLGKKIKSGSL